MNPIIHVLQRAMSAEIGIEVVVSDVEAFKRKFYSARKTQPTFSILSCKTCPTDPKHRVWIVKNGKTEISKEIPQSDDERL